MTAFSGRSGLLIDRLTFYCQPFELVIDDGAYEIWLGEGTALEPIGGSGGAAFPVTDCGVPGIVANGMRGRDGAGIDNFAITCVLPHLSY